MIEFDLAFNAKLKIWHNQEIAKISGYAIKDKTYQVTNKTSNVPSQCLIGELFIPRGGRNIYGLLGLKYVSEITGKLRVSVPFGHRQSVKNFTDAILQEPVFIGIPDEYGNYIVEAMDLLVASNQCNLSGFIAFCYGGYNQVSSNGWVFGKLTKILINCLSIGQSGFNSRVLQKILDT